MTKLLGYVPDQERLQCLGYALMFGRDYCWHYERLIGTNVMNRTKVEFSDAANKKWFTDFIEQFVCEVRRLIRGDPDDPEDQELRRSTLEYFFTKKTQAEQRDLYNFGKHMAPVDPMYTGAAAAVADTEEAVAAAAAEDAPGTAITTVADAEEAAAAAEDAPETAMTAASAPAATGADTEEAAAAAEAKLATAAASVNDCEPKVKVPTRKRCRDPVLIEKYKLEEFLQRRRITRTMSKHVLPMFVAPRKQKK